MDSSPLLLARQACDTLMRTYSAPELPPRGHFHYHQGVFLSGMHNTWLLTGEDRYFQYLKDWVDSAITGDGGIRVHTLPDLDDIQAGILLYPLLDHTGETRYRNAIEFLSAQVPAIPRCECGGFYHKVKLTRQMWLDGLYMAGPFIAEYGRRYGRPELLELAAEQVILMRAHTRDETTGLWYHAWDESRQAEWADPVTGRAPEFWGRSVGWVPVAVQNILDQMTEDTPRRRELISLMRELLESVCRYQGADGRWYQVLDKGEAPDNWPENSCTCLFVAALCKAVRLGYLDQSYAAAAKKGYEGVVRTLTWEKGDLQVGQVCVGTGVGDYAFYCARPVSVNDLHGIGAFLLMCTEMERLLALS